MLLKEYRICLPLTVDEYRVGQLYTISKHSLEQTACGEGVQVISNSPHTHPTHGEGQFTEKRIHLHSKLPQWARNFIPQIFYVTEKAWNWYPYTETEYSCSFLPRFSIRIQTHFQNNNGNNDTTFGDHPLPAEDVCHVDIVCDEVPERYYKPEEDLRQFRSSRTRRGPLGEGWEKTHDPVMCSYKRVAVRFDVYGLQTRVEQWVHKNIQDILLVGHRQAFAWVDEWIDMSLSDVREFESRLFRETNEKVSTSGNSDSERRGATSALEDLKPNFSRSVSAEDARLNSRRDPVCPRAGGKERCHSGQ